MQNREREQEQLTGWRRWLFEAEVAVIGTIMIAGAIAALWSAGTSVLKMLTR